MIVKIQLPTGGNTAGQLALIYDKSRKFDVQFPATPDVIEIMNGRLKVFFDAEVIDGQLELKGEVADQEW